MNKLLSQAIKLPDVNPSTHLDQELPINYPDDMSKLPLFSPNTTIGDILSRAIQFIFVIAGLGLLLMIIAAGFKLMTSAGDAKKMEMARGQLTNAILGFIVIFSAYWLVQVLGFMTGIDFSSIFK